MHLGMCRDPILISGGYFEQKNCQIWADCILDQDFVTYLQYDTKNYQHTYTSFIVFSTVSVVLSGIFIPVSIQSLWYQLSEDNYIKV